jgi:uncharacterized integral membrane protein
MSATSVEAQAPEQSRTPLAAETAPVAAGEPRGERFARHTRRVRLYVSAGAVVTVLVLLVVLASENTHAAKLNWVVGSTHASLAWIIAAAAVFGWLLGITTAIVVQRRTRRAH